MSALRFEVGGVSGYTIGPPLSRSGSCKRTTFYVFDMCRLAEIVYTTGTNSRKGQQEVGKARRRAQAECDRLNAWWQEELEVG